ncbi:MAG: hypothetical protein C0603_11205 [Denitrovibrio sp.]|nr:MAG: hypothetical protein C0603_11205 [Denitrovibrio sp.]
MKNNLLNPYVKGLSDCARSELHLDAKVKKTPSVEPDVGMFLEFFTRSMKPTSILELGCGIGVSSRYMSAGAPNAQVTAVDYNKSRLEFASESCKDNKQINFVLSDVIKFVREDKSTYDLIFIDSMKKQYPIVLYYALKRLNDGGVIIFDDVFMYGDIFKQDCELPRKYLPVVLVLREFINNIKQNYTHTLLPIGSGVLMVSK